MMHYRVLGVRDVLEGRRPEKRYPPSDPSITSVPHTYSRIESSVSSTSSWNGFLSGAWAVEPYHTAFSSANTESYPTPAPSIEPAVTTDKYGNVVAFSPTASTERLSPLATINPPYSSDFHDLDKGFSHGAKAGIIIACIMGFVAIVIASIWFCCGKPRRQRLKAQEEMQLHRERAEAAARADERPLGSSVQNLGTQIPPPTLEMTYSGAGTNDSMAPVQARGAVGRSASHAQRHIRLRGGGSDAPPSYEEAVPPTHQRLAGGMVQRGEPIQMAPPIDDEDGAGMVADGKMPISEMPLEDVVLDRSSNIGAESSASNFQEGGRDFHSRHAVRGGDTTGHSNV